MSRSAVRTAVAAFLAPTAVGAMEPGVYTGSQITGLATVRTSTPREIPATDYERGLVAPIFSSVVGRVVMARQSETRRSFGGQAPARGYKRRIYDIDLVLYGRSVRESAEDAQADFDATVDLIVGSIEADPTLGGRVWQAGESVEQSPSITVDFSEPAVDKGGALTCAAVIRFPVTEWIQA